MKTFLLFLWMAMACTSFAQQPLQVQASIPAFFRQGDRMEIPVTIRNLSSTERTGQVELQLTDAATGISVDGWFQNVFPNQYFTVASRSSTVALFPVELPFLFYKNAAWRCIVRSGRDSAVINGSFSVHHQGQPQQATLVTGTAGNYTLPALLQSEGREDLQHVGLYWQVVATSSVFAYAALPQLALAPAPPVVQLANDLFATAVQLQLSRNYPQAAQQLAQDLSLTASGTLPTDTSVLQARLRIIVAALNKEQQKTGAFRPWPAVEGDVATTQYLALTIGRLLQLKALNTPTQEQLFQLATRAHGYLEKNEKNGEQVLFNVYLYSMLAPNPGEVQQIKQILTETDNRPSFASAMAALVLWRNGDKDLARRQLKAAPLKTNLADAGPIGWLRHPVSRLSLQLEAAVITGQPAEVIDSLGRMVLAEMEPNRWTTPTATAAAVYALLLAQPVPPQPTPPTVVQWGKSTPEVPKGNLLSSAHLDGGRVNATLGNLRVGTPDAQPFVGLMQWQYVTAPEEAASNLLSRRVVLLHQKKAAPYQEGQTIKPGDILEITLNLETGTALSGLQLDAGRPAGWKPLASIPVTNSPVKMIKEQQDLTGTTWWISALPKGRHQLVYRVQATQAGTFNSGPVILSDYSSGKTLARLEGLRLQVE